MALALNRVKNHDVPRRAWPTDRSAPLVDIIIPARDEERNILPLFETLVQQRYPTGRWRIIVVNDGSTDRTADIVEALAEEHPNLELVHAPPLPAGWTGKNHAMYAGSLVARPDAEYLLFVDADTRHDALMLSSVVLRAEEVRTDLLSLVIRVDMESFWERLVVPEIGELYSLLVGTMDSVNREGGSGAAAANGQFMLVRPEVYRDVIAHPDIRSDVAEDRAIAAALKSKGRTVRLEYGEKLVHARVYSSLREMWAGYSKTIFWASGHNTPRTIGVALALFFYAFAPLLTLAGAYFKPTVRQRRRSLVHGLVQILPATLLRALVNRRLGVPLVNAFAYPLAVVVGDAILLHSLYRVVSGKGVAWKGRLYGETRQGSQ